MGSRASIMHALARAQLVTRLAIGSKETKKEERLLLEKQLAAITAGLMDMRSSTVVADVRLDGMCTPHHRSRLEVSGHNTVLQLITMTRKSLETILLNDFGSAVGILSLPLADSNHKVHREG